MPKIAIVTNTAWNIVNFRMGLMRALREQGNEVICIAPSDERVSFIEEQGFRFVPLTQLSRKGMNLLKDFSLIRELSRIYKEEQIDMAMHFTIKPNIYGSIAAASVNVKSICTVTGLGYTFLSQGFVHKITKVLFRLAFRKAEKVIFQNYDDQQLFVESRLVGAAKTLIIKGSGVNTEYFKPRHAQHTANGKIRLLYVGRLLYDKGLRELYEVSGILAREFPNLEIHIVGGIDNENPSAIRQEFLDKWLKEQSAVQYHGATDDIRPFIAEADVIVLPSYREGLPRTNLEAMCMEKPIITTDVPGCKDTVIEGMNGLMVEVKSPESLANAIRKIIRLDEAQRHAMGVHGRRLAIQDFDEKIVINKYLNVVNAVS